MNTKRLVDCAALGYFFIYGAVFLVQLLSDEPLATGVTTSSYLYFLQAWLALSFVNWTKQPRWDVTTQATDAQQIGCPGAHYEVINCLAFSAIVSCFLVWVATWQGHVVPDFLINLSTCYLVACWSIAAINQLKQWHQKQWGQSR